MNATPTEPVFIPVVCAGRTGSHVLTVPALEDLAVLVDEEVVVGVAVLQRLDGVAVEAAHDRGRVARAVVVAPGGVVDDGDWTFVDVSGGSGHCVEPQVLVRAPLGPAMMPGIPTARTAVARARGCHLGAPDAVTRRRWPSARHEPASVPRRPARPRPARWTVRGRRRRPLASGVSGRARCSSSMPTSRHRCHAPRRRRSDREPRAGSPCHGPARPVRPPRRPRPPADRPSRRGRSAASRSSVGGARPGGATAGTTAEARRPTTGRPGRPAISCEMHDAYVWTLRTGKHRPDRPPIWSRRGGVRDAGDPHRATGRIRRSVPSGSRSTAPRLLGHRTGVGEVTAGAARGARRPATTSHVAYALTWRGRTT